MDDSSKKYVEDFINSQFNRVLMISSCNVTNKGKKYAAFACISEFNLSIFTIQHGTNKIGIGKELNWMEITSLKQIESQNIEIYFANEKYIIESIDIKVIYQTILSHLYDIFSKNELETKNVDISNYNSQACNLKARIGSAIQLYEKSINNSKFTQITKDLAIISTDFINTQLISEIPEYFTYALQSLNGFTSVKKLIIENLPKSLESFIIQFFKTNETIQELYLISSCEDILPQIFEQIGKSKKSKITKISMNSMKFSLQSNKSLSNLLDKKQIDQIEVINSLKVMPIHVFITNISKSKNFHNIKNFVFDQNIFEMSKHIPLIAAMNSVSIANTKINGADVLSQLSNNEKSILVEANLSGNLFSCDKYFEIPKNINNLILNNCDFAKGLATLFQKFFELKSRKLFLSINSPKNPEKIADVFEVLENLNPKHLSSFSWDDNIYDERLINFLLKAKSLHEFSFSRVVKNDSEFSSLIKLLENLKKFTKITLAGDAKQIAGSTEKILSTLMHKKHIRHLDLSNRIFDEKCFEILAKMLNKRTKIVYVNFDGCGITDINVIDRFIDKIQNRKPITINVPAETFKIMIEKGTNQQKIEELTRKIVKLRNNEDEAINNEKDDENEEESEAEKEKFIVNSPKNLNFSSSSDEEIQPKQTIKFSSSSDYSSDDYNTANKKQNKYQKPPPLSDDDDSDSIPDNIQRKFDVSSDSDDDEEAVKKSMKRRQNLHSSSSQESDRISYSDDGALKSTHKKVIKSDDESSSALPAPRILGSSSSDDNDNVQQSNKIKLKFSSDSSSESSQTMSSRKSNQNNGKKNREKQAKKIKKEEKKLKEEQEKKLKEDQEKKLKEEQERKLKEEQERKLKVEQERKLKEEQERKLKEEQERKLKEEQERKLKEEQEKKLKEEQERKLKEEQEKKLKEEQERKLKEEQEKNERNKKKNNAKKKMHEKTQFKEKLHSENDGENKQNERDENRRYKKPKNQIQSSESEEEQPYENYKNLDSDSSSSKILSTSNSSSEKKQDKKKQNKSYFVESESSHFSEQKAQFSRSTINSPFRIRPSRRPYIEPETFTPIEIREMTPARKTRPMPEQIYEDFNPYAKMFVQNDSEDENYSEEEKPQKNPRKVNYRNPKYAILTVIEPEHDETDLEKDPKVDFSSDDGKIEIENDFESDFNAKKLDWTFDIPIILQPSTKRKIEELTQQFSLRPLAASISKPK